ncbi:hypothetical protein [Nocardia huaxiensis]|uniref:hypothetical protein n=1 Tax=Nocardia huaxiensis TaxID=2755382 RepID=UPI001E5B3354|nr:hypothetical protein [Nocardia huaxiensis]UFS96107.1 hypothetical protein LPY97_36600 [Nocardia huaxiensis]
MQSRGTHRLRMIMGATVLAALPVFGLVSGCSSDTDSGSPKSTVTTSAAAKTTTATSKTSITQTPQAGGGDQSGGGTGGGTDSGQQGGGQDGGEQGGGQPAGDPPAGDGGQPATPRTLTLEEYERMYPGQHCPGNYHCENPRAGYPDTTTTRTPAPTTTPQKKCTERFDYTGDPRTAAEINTLGEWNMGKCPDPIKPTTTVAPTTAPTTAAPTTTAQN